MPYKPKFWPTIVRKSDYCKHLSGREFERAESIPCRLGHSFCHLLKPLLPCLTVEFSDARYVKYILITNFTVINIIYCNAEGLRHDLQTSTVKQHQIGGPARQERVT